MGLNYLFSSAARITSLKRDAWNPTLTASEDYTPTPAPCWGTAHYLGATWPRRLLTM